MNHIFIIIDSSIILDSSTAGHQGDFASFLKKKVGKPCFVLRNTWAVETSLELNTVRDLIRDEVGLEFKFIVAQASGPWVAQNAPTKKKCFG
jgi:hypothetical protein